MKVLTFDNEELLIYSQKLAVEVFKSDFIPDVIIGIKTGGTYVSRPLHEEFIKKNNPTYFELELSRPLSKKKKKYNINKILKYLPYCILNIMRNIEVYLYETMKDSNYILKRQEDIILSEEEINIIKNSRNILLVDDAADTGATLMEIKQKLKNINNSLNIKSAVLTVTHKKCYVSIDYFVFKRVLLRCPWANDYKGNYEG